MEVINIPIGDTPVTLPEGLTAHEQAMIDKVDGKTTENNPEVLLAGKYKDEASLDKGTIELITKLWGSKEEGYKKLESLLGKPKTEDGKAPLPTIETPKKDETKPLEIPKAEDTLKNVGLDFKEFDKEYQEKGQLSEASYQKLAEKGLSKELVDTYIEGVKAKVALQTAEGEKVVNAVYELTGGKEAYEVMVKWAAANLTPDEIQVLNEGLLGDMAHAKIAAETLKQKYTTVNGKNPLLYMGSSPNSTIDVFRDKAEMMAAMKDPRYKTSEAYRAEVALKVGRSKIFG